MVPGLMHLGPTLSPFGSKLPQVDQILLLAFPFVPQLHVLGMASLPEGVKELRRCFFITTPSVTICSAESPAQWVLWIYSNRSQTLLRLVNTFRL